MQEIIGSERLEDDKEVAESKGSQVEEEAVDHGLQVSQFVKELLLLLLTKPQMDSKYCQFF